MEAGLVQVGGGPLCGCVGLEGGRWGPNVAGGERGAGAGRNGTEWNGEVTDEG